MNAGQIGGSARRTAVSMLDRLLHHRHVVITDGDPYRMKQARAREVHPGNQLKYPEERGL